jgi:hypothetical protein
MGFALKIEIREAKNPDKSACEHVRAIKRELEDFLSGLDFDGDSISAASNKIKVPLFSWADAHEWKRNRLVNPGIPSGIPTSVYKVNLLRDLPNCACGRHHRIFFHAFFDNRQAIGTNLLRLCVAKKYFEQTIENEAELIALVIDTKSKDFFGWDNSVGTVEEYEYALTKIYNFALEPEINFWVIRS